MELRELECFVAVADAASFSKAAHRLHVVQSAVSATVRRLEADLAVSLIDRSTNPVGLTAAGAAFLPRAREVLAAATVAREAASHDADRVRGPLTLGMLASVTSVDLPALLARYARAHPDVEIRLRTAPGGSRELARQVVERDVDAAFLSLPGAPPSGLDVTELARRTLSLVVHQGHRLAGAGQVGLAQLADERFVDSPAGHGNRMLVDRAFAAAGVVRSVALEVPDIGTAADYIALGLGVGFLSPDLIAGREDLVAVRVRAADLTWRLFLATAAGRSPTAALRAFLNLLAE